MAWAIWYCPLSSRRCAIAQVVPFSSTNAGSIRSAATVLRGKRALFVLFQARQSSLARRLPGRGEAVEWLRTEEDEDPIEVHGASLAAP